MIKEQLSEAVMEGLEDAGITEEQYYNLSKKAKIEIKRCIGE